MLKTGDDLPKLFRSLGNSAANSRPAAGTTTNDAEQRWPLLKAMPPKEPPQAPLLTARDRQNWQSQEPDAQRPPIPAPAPAPASLGDKLALSLKEMSAHAKTEQSPKKTRARPAAAAATQEQTRSTAPAMPKVPAAVLAGSPLDAIKPTKAGKKPAADIKGEPDFGILWSPKELAAALPTSEKPRLDDSLKSVFGRLEPTQKEIKPPVVEKRPSYLGRLGRK